MEELSPLSPSSSEIAIGLVALVSAIFWPFWVIGSIASWRAISARWAEHRLARRSPVPAI